VSIIVIHMIYVTYLFIFEHRIEGTGIRETVVMEETGVVEHLLKDRKKSVNKCINVYRCI
jgi:hypothetical protein